MKYKNAQQAFEDLFSKVKNEGILFSNCLTLFNIGFTIENPLDNCINTSWRKWNKNYADLEWDWYLSGERSVKEIGKHAKIWLNIADENGNVNSNYGWQWQRNDQLKKVINILKNNKESRQAVLSFYDGKEISSYGKDTVCTLAVNFFILKNKLEMTVMMRSNDLVFGFCNDQYCFSKLQELVAKELEIEVGSYYHFATNLHIYPRHFNLNKQENDKLQ
jgi:thymidylate synthase